MHHKGIERMKDCYRELFHYIAETDESCASDILYSLELVKTSLNTTLKRIKKEIQVAAEKNAFDGIRQIADYCERITELDQEIETIIAALDFKPAETTSFPSENKPVFPVSPMSSPADPTINYSVFDVDKTEPHTLDEDFEYKKVCCIQIQGTRIPVNNWQDALVKLCVYLYSLDGQKMESFVDDPAFQRRKVHYFMHELVPRRNKLIPGTDLYVWINNSANTLVSVMRSLLISYRIPLKNMTLYLRRDLSDLHR